MKPMLHYRIWSLDVWGHGPDEHEKYECDGNCDGYNVNDRSEAGEINVNAETKVYNEGKAGQFSVVEAPELNLYWALTDGGYLDCAMGDLQFEYGDNDIFIDRKSDGKPLLQLEGDMTETEGT